MGDRRRGERAAGAADGGRTGRRAPGHLRRDGVAFFFKQWGGLRPKSGGRLLDGEEWNAFPWRIVPPAIKAELEYSA